MNMNGPRAVLSMSRSSDELAHLRKRVDQQERSLAVLVQAVSALRSANAALRDENRELQMELQRARHAGRAPHDAVPAATA